MSTCTSISEIRFGAHVFTLCDATGGVSSQQSSVYCVAGRLPPLLQIYLECRETFGSGQTTSLVRFSSTDCKTAAIIITPLNGVMCIVRQIEYIHVIIASPFGKRRWSACKDMYIRIQPTVIIAHSYAELQWRRQTLRNENPLKRGVYTGYYYVCMCIYVHVCLLGWQQRWFVLESGILAYYLAPSEVNQGCRGSLKVASCDIVGKRDQMYGNGGQRAKCTSTRLCSR